jgi:SAM-dependent methyltransferase
VTELDLSRVRRLVALTDPDDTLRAAAARRAIPVEVVAIDHEHLLERLVETVADGRDTVIVGTGAAAEAAARRTGADLWDPERGVLTSSTDCRDEALEHLHADNPDPWGVETRWFERRKRELVLAMLPRQSFERSLELGCSTGALAEALAARSRHVVAVDQSSSAVTAAAVRFQDDDRVDVAQLEVPRQWPSGRFDLVVVSEVGYFMSAAGLERLVERVAGALTPDGVVVLCHWRHPIEGWPLDADAVRDGFQRGELHDVAARYLDRDIEILVLAGRDNWPDSAM